MPSYFQNIKNQDILITYKQILEFYFDELFKRYQKKILENSIPKINFTFNLNDKINF